MLVKSMLGGKGEFLYSFVVPLGVSAWDLLSMKLAMLQIQSIHTCPLKSFLLEIYERMFEGY